MTELDRDAIVDTALGIFLKRGYNPTTLADIASALDVEPGRLAAEFPDKEAFVLAVVDVMFAAVFEELAAAPLPDDLVDALRVAHQTVVGRVIAGEGPVPLLRMHRMGRVIASNPVVAQSVSQYRKRMIAQGLAEQSGVSPDDPAIVKAVTVWSAVMASTHAAAVHDDDEPDRYATDLTTQRLDRTFNLVRRTRPKGPPA